ncbi:MAG TPA: hypothetical protein VJ728_05540 [Candidatus Binataceae bacterium]|nr:hypothetical protein [Candidatus Binataceae bacterium]
MLLNEFLKEHKKVESQAAELQLTKPQVARQSKEIAELKAALKEQAAQIRKVSARLESTRPVTQLVVWAEGGSGWLRVSIARRRE